jgi:glycosyltransferase involved in cell wall biosynthesis
MRILLISQYFFTRDQAGSARLYEFGRMLAAAGHRPVLITTFIDNFRKEVPEKYRGRWLAREMVDGLEIIRVRAYAGYRGSYARRIINFLSFAATATLAALRSGPCDVVFGTTPPTTVGAVAWLISRLKRRPLIFEVRDLWPEAAVELGLLRNRPLIAALTAAERFLAQQARSVIALTPGLKRRLVSGKGIPASKIAVVTNAMNPEDYGPPTPPEAAKAARSLSGRFVVMQAGSIGASDDLHVMVRAAEVLSRELEFVFVLVGDGDARPGLQQLVRTLGLDNVLFWPTVPRREVPGVLSTADVLICQIPGFYGDCALPNRLFDYLAAGRAVITTGEGDCAELLLRGQAGLVVPPGDPQALAAAIRTLRDDPERCRSLGRNGWSFVREHYSWAAQFPRYLEIFEAAGGKAAGASLPASEARSG